MLGRRNRRPRNACMRLRAAVEQMPDHAKRAMLAAHRNGGRIDLAGFARSWDRYTDADGPRPATPRELRTLVALLESSLADGPGPAPAPERPRPSRPRVPFRIRRVRPERGADAPQPAGVA